MSWCCYNNNVDYQSKNHAQFIDKTNEEPHQKSWALFIFSWMEIILSNGFLLCFMHIRFLAPSHIFASVICENCEIIIYNAYSLMVSVLFNFMNSGRNANKLNCLCFLCTISCSSPLKRQNYKTKNSESSCEMCELNFWYCCSVIAHAHPCHVSFSSLTHANMWDLIRDVR